MIDVVLFFLFVSTLFYLIFAGADFGVGILELFSMVENKKITKLTAYRIIGPVWEANHIWLILCIVILWIAFPMYYYLIVTQLHIPITLLLVGIIGRGTSFVFRHYDAHRGSSQKVYDIIFQLSSFVAPFFLGVCAGALVSGELIHPEMVEGYTFKELYVDSWLNIFSILVGFFVVALNAFTAAIFLSGDTEGEEYDFYIAKAKRTNGWVVLSGFCIAFDAVFYNRELGILFIQNKLTLIVFVLVALLVIPLWKSLLSGNKLLPGFLVSLQLFLILFAWSALAFPNLIFVQEGHFSILENLPPSSVFNSLGYSLLIAAVLVLPGLYHLFRTFGLFARKK